MSDILKLQDGYIITDGFDRIKGRKIYFARYGGGLAIAESIKEEEKQYYCVKAEDKIKDDVLYKLLEAFDATWFEFTYFEYNKTYYELRRQDKTNVHKKLAKPTVSPKQKPCKIIKFPTKK